MIVRGKQSAVQQLALVMGSILLGEQAMAFNALRLGYGDALRIRSLLELQTKSDMQLRSRAVMHMRAPGWNTP